MGIRETILGRALKRIGFFLLLIFPAGCIHSGHYLLNEPLKKYEPGYRCPHYTLQLSQIVQDTDYRPMDSGCESRPKKVIGKPYSGKLNVRFDEGIWN